MSMKERKAEREANDHFVQLNRKHPGTRRERLKAQLESVGVGMFLGGMWHSFFGDKD